MRPRIDSIFRHASLSPFVAAVSLVAAASLVPHAFASASQWEVQGEMQLTEILDDLDAVVQEHASSQQAFENAMTEVDAALRDAVEEMKSSEAGSPRFRIAKAEWSEHMSRKISEKLAWAEQNVDRSRRIAGMIERALGLVTEILDDLADDPSSHGGVDVVRRDMVRLGAQIGLVLHEAAPEGDAETRAALRSAMLGLSELQNDHHGTGTAATLRVYGRLESQLDSLLAATGDLLARNRVQVERNRVDADRLEAMVIRDLASMSVARLEAYTRVLTAPEFLDGESTFRDNADDFREIEEMEARQAGTDRPRTYSLETREGFSRLLRGGNGR